MGFRHRGLRSGILLRLALQDGEDGVDDGYGIPLLALWQTFVTNTSASLGTWDFGTGVYGSYEDTDGIYHFFFCFSRREGQGRKRELGPGQVYIRITYIQAIPTGPG